MADAVELKATKRETTGGRATEKLRKQGLVPAIIYGHKEATVAVALESEALLHAIRHGARVVDLKSDGASEKALIYDLQWDHLGKHLLHVDFRRTSLDERITVNVPIELRGIAPGATGGGVLDQPLHVLEVECLAVNIPEHIRVNISELQLGGVIHVRDLVLPKDVLTKHAADAIVVQVKSPQAEPEPGAGPLGGPVEPEIVGRRVAAEPEEEAKK